MNGNPYVVCDLLGLIQQTAAKMLPLVKVKRETDGNGLGLEETYESILLDELGHLQAITLALTKELTTDSHSDESAFFEGELEHKKGEVSNDG